MSFPPNPSTGGGGTTDHSVLINRDAVEQHPVGAITNLTTSLGAKASSTTAAQTIWVDKAATGAGTGVDWTNAFISVTAAVNSLPAIINHAVTIYVRKGSTAYAGTTTIKRVVAGGSITIRGEYYWINTIASAGSGAGKFNVNASDTGIAAGDKVLLMKYTSTVGASRPDDAFVDTVASVSGTEITLTTRTSDTFTASWRYTIVRTEIYALAIQSDYTIVRGLYLNSGSDATLTIEGCFGPKINECICESKTQVAVFAKSVMFNVNTPINNIGVICGASGGNAMMFSSSFLNFGIVITNVAILSAAIAAGSGRGHFCSYESTVILYYTFIKGLTSGDADGVLCNGGSVALSGVTVDGYDGSNKLPNGLRAINGGTISGAATFGSNITTQKTPANWAATTDGSYVA